MEIISKNLKDTKKIASDVAKKLVKKSGPLVIALYGDLGSGKTTFAQFFAKSIGIKEKILSPTFVVMKTFEKFSPRVKTRMGKFKCFVHVDTYRLKSEKDLADLGFKEILKDQESIILIEWPEKIEKLLPKNTVKIYFETIGEKKRKIKIINA
jgi:tRNA threonylcarbamoyladenosine biosynthesis protein TsaE